MRKVIAAIEGEYRRYKKLGEGAMSQLSDAQLAEGPAEGNSVATIVWHIAGNLKSRSTDFLTSDGEKSWRDRDSEFLPRNVGRSDVLAKWEDGWKALLDALRDLTDEPLDRNVTIREVPLSVLEALQRSLAHTSYHVGQIVFLAKSLRGAEWKSLSIPPGKSQEYLSMPVDKRPH